ncbi:twin-arginine translocation signal domain-containing protein [Ramlibacter sp.]|uniref:twin-arginine translocation signal domain-containing protein n=1 Tax=Ramlibacter sp. TaxID=1917967 RepID=UPI0035B1A2DC
MSDRKVQPSRRGFMLGAAAASAATAAVVSLPKAPLPAEAARLETPPAPERGGGYHVSEHVKQYYKTTLI